MTLQDYTKNVLLVAIIVTVSFFSPNDAFAVPSFARQTGMSCSACHTVFPELRPFGRVFKLSGFVISRSDKPYQFPPPIAGMFQGSFTHTNRAQPSDTVDNVWSSNFTSAGNNNVSLPQQLSAFYGGKIFWKIGGLVQGTYDGVAEQVFLDNTDVRFADSLDLAGKKLIYGLTVNNAPTVEDVWNSTPAWGFPYASSGVAPTPAAGTLIDGGLSQQVGGVGLYGFWNNWIYAQAGVYRTALKGVTEFLGAGTETDTVTDGAVPYWRLALQHQWGSHYFELGTYGLFANVFPGGSSSGPTDQFWDVALDAEYQYLKGKHVFTAETTWIHENQDWDASYTLGDASNSSDSLDTFRFNLNYYYLSQIGTFGGTVGYFQTTGDSDSLLYSPDPVDGSRNGNPDSNGFLLQANYLPWERCKFALQYVIYDKFNGSSSNYDGFGRDASDNNTLYFLVWVAF